jgi:hypothetical protein
VQVTIDEHSIHIRLALWQKVLGLMGNIEIPRADLTDVQVVQQPLRQVAAAGLKAGLRVPGYYYVARTLRLDEAFVVRRGVPALSLSLDGEGSLRRVIVSTPGAAELAQALQPQTAAAS